MAHDIKPRFGQTSADPGQSSSADPSSQSDHVLVFDGMPLVVRSEVARKLIAMVQRVARYPHAILIQGETGSGKELVARAIHHYSLRCTRPWVDVNCAALPENLVESELFGHEKGAFSGADFVKAGFFEMAHQATLFLDEIGELDQKVQVKLLRVLDGVPYYRLGGNKKVTVDVRIVTATNRDLAEAVAKHTFRSDLYHRLNQILIRVPPLRERPEDIVGMAELFLQQLNPKAHFSPEALAALQRYEWPGNVRELKNVVTQLSTIETPAEVIEPQHLPSEITSATEHVPEVPVGDLDNMERLMIEQALLRSAGDQTAAAERLGISRRTLSRKLKQYDLEAAERRVPAMGALSAEQQRYFRANAEAAVVLRTETGYQLTARSANISSSGIGLVGVSEPFNLSGTLDLSLSLASDQAPILAKGKMSWADTKERAGIRFVSIEPSSQMRLEQWLAARVQNEGWSTAR